MPLIDGECADIPEASGIERRPLEEMLASVMEGEGVVYSGDGIQLLVKPSTIDAARAKRRRRRSGRSRERALMFTTAVRHPEEVVVPVVGDEAELAESLELNPSRAEPRGSEGQREFDPEIRAMGEALLDSEVSVEDETGIEADIIAEALEASFRPDSGSQLENSQLLTRNSKLFPIPVRFAEHARSPFVVSLRGLALRADPFMEDERIPQTDVLAYDIAPNAGIPDLEILEALAQDLSIDESDGFRYSEQFTPSRFSSSYASAYGPVTKFLDRIGLYADRMIGSFSRRRLRAKADGAGSPVRAVAGSRCVRAPRAAIVRVPVARTVVVMGALAFVAMLPANVVRLARTLEEKRAGVTNAGTDAAGLLADAANANLSISMDALRKASDGFRAADDSLSKTNALAVALANIVPKARESYASARALLEVGAKTSDAGRLLAKGLDAALSGEGRGILDRLGVFSAYADGALPLLDDAGRALANVKENAVPESERPKIAMLRDGLETGRLAAREFVGTSELLARLLGRDKPRRFLILFQNPNEIRPTGGFMGSYAELDLDRGAVERLVIPGGGTYDLQGQLVKQIVPPEPLRLVANRWELQDANWSPDFPTAAKKIGDLWSASGGYTVDGIVAVNATVVADLLKIAGPVEIPELGKTLTSENAVAEIQLSAEVEYDRAENKPKKILSLAGPRLMEKLKELPPEDLVRALAVFSDAIARKEIQIALTDPEEDALAQGFDWSGRLKETSGDSLAVVNANIAGGKTDAVMSESITHAASIAEDGSIADTVRITRTHSGVKRAPLTGVRNVEYVRLYVPLGSALVSADGFATSPRALIEEPREDAVPDADVSAAEVSRKSLPGSVDLWDEGNRTVIGGWHTIDPGETKTVTVSYRLPFSAFDIQSRLSGSSGERSGGRAAYSLLLTSQSGVHERTVSSSVAVPPSWGVSWSRGLGAPSAAWDRDRVVSSLYENARP